MYPVDKNILYGLLRKAFLDEGIDDINLDEISIFEDKGPISDCTRINIKDFRWGLSYVITISRVMSQDSQYSMDILRSRFREFVRSYVKEIAKKSSYRQPDRPIMEPFYMSDSYVEGDAKEIIRFKRRKGWGVSESEKKVPEKQPLNIRPDGAVRRKVRIG